MKKTLLISIFSLFTFLISNVSVAQINTGSPAVPFGSNTQYEYGIVPTNASQQDAIDAYNAWKTNYVESCSGDRYRVLFGPDENYNTVSEGIAYGMILSVYASDKTLFDGLWAYYKQFKNGNGVMDWKISGCDGGVVSTGAATDAELDAAMALIIAAEQWADNTYTNDARVLIQAIKNTEMASDGQTLNGDQWGNTNTCRNPSYQAPAYYTEFAKVDTDNASFWSTTAVNAASTLLLANRNSTSGLVSNWSDNNGTENECGNTGSGAYGYGADACRNPWRMATDFLWHGSNACAAADDINAKLVNFVNGYENQLKGPISDRSVSNPSSGSYVNGSYTTYALAVMTDASAQTSLNKCYTAVASLSDVDQLPVLYSLQ
jgi:endo-1,4-beta-D-glucanase Y